MAQGLLAKIRDPAKAGQTLYEKHAVLNCNLFGVLGSHILAQQVVTTVAVAGPTVRRKEP